jgi:FAD/FMN-containing dehydrogenase
LEQLLETVPAAGIRPCSVTVLDPAAARLLAASLPASGSPGALREWLVLVGFENNAAAVDSQLARLRQAAAPAGAFRRALLDETDQPIEQIWRKLADLALRGEGPITFKANLLPRDLAGFCRQAAALIGVAGLQAEAASGIVIGHTIADLTLDAARRMLTPLLDAAAAGQGNVVLLRCPAAWKSELPVWGRPRADWALMRVIKQQLDPTGLFNPGRFVDGI